MSHGFKRVYGIDLGTTYSAIAYVDEHGRPVIVPNQESERITPSVVLFDGEDVIVGNAAKEASKTEPDRVVMRVKHHMGAAHPVFELDGQAFAPEDISSFILRKVVSDAEIALGEAISDVVITCPAYFGVEAREATATAGKLAGLNVRAILNEPTAAAIAYGLEDGDDQTVLVYDLGGGTFDITMIEIKDRLIRVIGTGGDHQLGGAHWDEAIVVHLADEFRRETGLEDDPMDDPEVLNDLFLQAERGKKTLTLRDRAAFRVTHAGQEVRVELTREAFDDLTRHLLERTLELTREMLDEARGKGHERFDKIILVGGATRMPQVRSRLTAEFGIEPESYDPDEAVAKGAALFGLRETIHDEVRDVLVEQGRSTPDQPLDLDALPDATLTQALDQVEHVIGFTLPGPVRALVKTRIVNVLSQGLGVVAHDEHGKPVVVYLLPRNSEVPLAESADFGTDQPNQVGVEIKVMAGEHDSPEPDQCHEVGVAMLDLPDGLPVKSPIRVSFAIDRDGRLGVSAVDLTGGGSIHTVFAVESSLRSEEIEERLEALNALHVS